jgi:hypothetical protein
MAALSCNLHHTLLPTIDQEAFLARLNETYGTFRGVGLNASDPGECNDSELKGIV